MPPPGNDGAPASRPVANDDDGKESSAAREHAGSTEPPLRTCGPTEGEADARGRGENVTVPRSTDAVQASEPAGPLGPGIGREVAAAVDTSGATGQLVRLDSTSRDLDAFQQSVAAWAQSALVVLETTTNERERITVRDEAIRIAGVAAAVDAGVAVAIANDVLQRAVRSIGKNTSRRRAGRRRSAASAEATPDPVGGDTTPASKGLERGQRPRHVGENRSPGGTNTVDGPGSVSGGEAAPEGGQRPRHVGENRSPGGTNSVGGPRSTTGDLPRATRSAYRKDAESVSDPGFERISASVRAAATAAPAAGHKLDRGLVRAAGAVEDAGGDPGDLQAVEAKKQELSDARKGSAVAKAPDALPPCYVSPRLIEVVRRILDERIDLDPASTAAQNRHAHAGVFYDGTDASWPGLKAAWPKDARVWVHVPRGADAAVFVQRVLTHAEAGAPVVVLTENRTHLPWAQSLLAVAAAVCFIAGDAMVQRPGTDDPSVVEIGEAPLAAPQGHLLVGLNVDRTTFEQGCAGLGVCFAQGADQDGPAGILASLRFLPFGRKTTMPAS